MIIDWHTHIAAPRMREAGIVEGNWPGTIENVLRLHDEVGLDWSVIWSPSHYLRSMELGDCHTALVASNRDFAKLRDAHGDKILFFATTVPGGGEDFLREVERTVTEDDARGVVINSSHRGAYPDDPEALAFFELAQSLDIPVIVHPPAVGFGEERMDNYSLASSIGRPFDNCLAVGRLIVMGILEKFPDLKLVASHLGGGISEIIGRMDYAYEMRDDDTVLGPYTPLHITKPPSEYLKMMYFDTVSYHAPAVACAAQTVGADRLIFGTDAPNLISLKQRGLDLIAEAGISGADLAKVLGGTARGLLRI